VAPPPLKICRTFSPAPGIRLFTTLHVLDEAAAIKPQAVWLGLQLLRDTAGDAEASRKAIIATKSVNGVAAAQVTSPQLACANEVCAFTDRESSLGINTDGTIQLSTCPADAGTILAAGRGHRPEKDSARG